MRRWIVGLGAPLLMLVLTTPADSPALILGVASSPEGEQGFVRTRDGLRLFYRKTGSRGATVVVFGAAEAATAFARLGAGRTLVCVDARGSGRSDAVADASRLGVARDVEDIEAVRRHVGAERISIVALPGRGPAAILYAAAHPERVERVVQFVEASGPLRTVALEAGAAPEGLSRVEAPVLAIAGASDAGAPEWTHDVPNLRLITTEDSGWLEPHMSSKVAEVGAVAGVSEATVAAIGAFLRGRWPAGALRAGEEPARSGGDRMMAAAPRARLDAAFVARADRYGLAPVGGDRLARADRAAARRERQGRDAGRPTATWKPVRPPQLELPRRLEPRREAPIEAVFDVAPSRIEAPRFEPVSVSYRVVARDDAKAKCSEKRLERAWRAVRAQWLERARQAERAQRAERAQPAERVRRAERSKRVERAARSGCSSSTERGTEQVQIREE